MTTERVGGRAVYLTGLDAIPVGFASQKPPFPLTSERMNRRRFVRLEGA